jgi:hypothetical protein
MASNDPPSSSGQVLNAVKFVADTAILPGSSQLIEGSVGAGLVYGAAGLAARTVFGPWLWLGIGLDSYSKSASGKHLWELFGSAKSETPEVPKVSAEPASK